MYLTVRPSVLSSTMLLTELRSLTMWSNECWILLTVSPTWCLCTLPEASLRKISSSSLHKSPSRFDQFSTPVIQSLAALHSLSLILQVLLMGKMIDPTELDFLLRYPAVLNVVSPVDFLSHSCWGGVKALSNMEQFRNLDKDIEVYTYSPHQIMTMQLSYISVWFCCHQGSAKRWKKFTDSECPEKEKFPGEWKNKNSLQRLCMMRALRPDRMTYAVMWVTVMIVWLFQLIVYIFSQAVCWGTVG